jgi:membrane protein implicated in regulation of membrane protease activity
LIVSISGAEMKILWWSLAAVLILLGLATVWLPSPTGVPLLALGSVVIIGTSRSAARHLRKRRKSAPHLNGMITWVEDRSPLRFARILKRTRPRKK